MAAGSPVVSRWLAPLLLVCAAGGALAAEERPRPADPRLATVWKRDIHLFRERTAEHLGHVELPRGWAQNWWLHEAGQRLGVLGREGLLSQKGPLQLSIVDLAGPKLVSSEPLEGSLQFLVRTSDGRVGFLAMLGGETKKKQAATPPRLVRVDLVAGGPHRSRPLAEPPNAIVLTSDGAELVLVYAGASGKTRADRKPGRVEVLDTATLEPKASLALPGPADGIFWNGDRTRLYAEDVGLDDAQPEIALPGRLYVVDPKRAALLADLELGIGPGPLGWDDERGVFYVLVRPKKAKDAGASLLVVGGEAIEREFELPARPTAVVPNPDRSRFYVLEEKGVTVVDAANGEVVTRLSLSDTPTGVLPVEEKNRVFVGFAGSSKVASIDLGTRQLLAQHTTGRTGKKVGLFAAAVLGTALSQVNSYMLTGNQYAMAQVVTYPSPETSGVLSPDRKLGFFYNSQTGDYTVIDVETNRMIDQIAGGGLQFLDGGRTAFVSQVTDVVLWSVEQRRLLAEIDAGGGGKVLCPDGDHVWAIAGIRSLNLVDLAQRTVTKKFDELGGSLLFFDAGAGAGAEAPAPPSE